MSSADLDLLPEAEASADLRHFRTRPLVLPGGALVALTVDDHVL
jgi:hypothetical protein